MTILERERPQRPSTAGNIGLRVNGREYGGWKSASVTRGIESLSGSFRFTASERWADGGWPIYEEDECSCVIGTKKLISGYVDQRSISYGAGDHGLSFSGRDAAGSLVDCSAKLDAWEFRGIGLLAFVKKICAPFNIPVSLQSGLVLPTPPAKFSIDPGDSASSAIEEACRLAGVLPFSDGVGGLVLARAGTARASSALVEGENILSASVDYDASGRFSSYVALGQGRGSDDFFGTSASRISGKAVDANVKRTARVLVIRPEGNVTGELAKKRAEWEATTRAARAATIAVTVQGWLQSDGVLWPINTLATLRSPSLGIDGDLLIVSATYAVDDRGSTTILQLRSPTAFQPQPTLQKNDGRWAELRRGV